VVDTGLRREGAEVIPTQYKLEQNGAERSDLPCDLAILLSNKRTSTHSTVNIKPEFVRTGRGGVQVKANRKIPEHTIASITCVAT
jgi:hypothetical protein